MLIEDYGDKIPFDPLWNGPWEGKRDRTDFRFLIVFGICLVSWIGIGIYALSSGNLKNSEYTKGDIVAILIILKSLGLAGFISSLYSILLRWFAKEIVWSTVFLFCLTQFLQIIGNLQKESKNFYYIIFLMISLVISIMCSVIYRKKIKVACEIFKEASRVVIFFPSVFLLLIPTLILYFIVVYFTVNVCNQLWSIQIIKNSIFIKIIIFWNLIVSLWIIFFISGFTEMVTSNCFATWFWTKNKNEVKKNILLHSIITAARYHLGTVAFGSLIIPIFGPINLLLGAIKEYLERKCFRFKSFGTFMQYIDKSAYLMTAVYGTDFSESAKNVFNLKMRNILKLLVTTSVTTLVFLLGNVVATYLSLEFAFYLCMNSEALNLYHLIAVFIFVFPGAFFVSETFFSIFKTAMDTVFVCALEDFERNDGSEERSYFMSEKLQKLLLK